MKYTLIIQIKSTVSCECHLVNSPSDLVFPWLVPSFLHFLQTSLDWTFCPHALWAVDGIDHINSPLRKWTDVRASGQHGFISPGTALFHPRVGNSGNRPTVWVTKPEDSLNQHFNPTSVLSGPSEVLPARYWTNLWRRNFPGAGWLRAPRRPTATGHQQPPAAGQSRT